jgi:hypothetical protein
MFPGFGLSAVQGPEDAVDPVAGVTVDAADAPGVEPFDDEVANGIGHHALLEND